MTHLVSLVVPILAVALILLILCMGYVKAPPDKAYIISGLRKSKDVIGRAAIRIPFLERLDKLDLAAIQIDVKTSTAVPTKNYINVRVDSVVSVKIPTKDILADDGTVIFKAVDLLSKAKENFLNKNANYISTIAREVLEGNIREIIGQLNLEEMVSDRQKFADLVKENALPDLAEYGLTIVSFNVQNFIDDSGTIENLGIDNIESIRKKAAIAKANAKKEIQIAESAAEKEANDARVESDLEIAKKNNDLEIRKAELKKEADTQLAIAEAAHTIQTEEQRKIIEVKTADANIARQEKEVELAEQKARIQERQLEAEIKKQADADKYKAEKHAEAEKYRREQEAEAELIERTKDAEAELLIAEKKAAAEKLQAEAQRYAMEQEAAGIEAKGLAEAKAIEAQGLAKAKGLDAEAEAMRKMESAAVIKTIMEQLPLIAKELAAPLANVDSITMYGEGNTSKLVEDLTKSLSQVTNGVTDSLGIDLKSIINAILSGKVAGNAIVDAGLVCNCKEVKSGE